MFYLLILFKVRIGQEILICRWNWHLATLRDQNTSQVTQKSLWHTYSFSTCVLNVLLCVAPLQPNRIAYKCWQQPDLYILKILLDKTKTCEGEVQKDFDTSGAVSGQRGSYFLLKACFQGWPWNGGRPTGQCCHFSCCSELQSLQCANKTSPGSLSILLDRNLRH